MKALFVLKACVYLPLLWFVGYVIMVLIGCIACSCGATDSFYCGMYCKFGIALMSALTGGFVLYNVYKYLKSCKS